jgi:ferredoxin
VKGESSRVQAPEEIEVQLAGRRLKVARQVRLLDVCDASPDLPFVFGCREGGCGTCLVAVEPGSGVNEVDEVESIILEAMSIDSPEARLGCQLRIVGPAVIDPWPDTVRR